MHLGHPVTQAILDHAAHDRLIGIERVAATGVVGITGPVLLENVIGLIGQTAIAQRRPRQAAFRCVIEYNIEDDFESGAVERFDHVPKLIEDCERALQRAVRLMRGEQRNGRIAPIVALSRRTVLRVELEDRQQLQGGNSEIFEVGDLLDQSSVCTALIGGDTRAGMASEPRNMELVNHGFRDGPFERQIALPVIKTGIGYDAFHGYGDIIARPCGGQAVVCLGDGRGETVGIEKDLLGVKPKTTVRIKGPVCPVGIHLARLDVRDKDMPVVIGAMLTGIERYGPYRLLGILVIEQEQLDHARMLREHAEIHAARANSRAERSGYARHDDATAHRQVIMLLFRAERSA